MLDHVKVIFTAQATDTTTQLSYPFSLGNNREISWAIAKQQCEENNMTLATVTSQQKSEQIKSFLDRNGGKLLILSTRKIFTMSESTNQ